MTKYENKKYKKGNNDELMSQPGSPLTPLATYFCCNIPVFLFNIKRLNFCIFWRRCGVYAHSVNGVLGIYAYTYMQKGQSKYIF